jgi:hypothetical protein
MCELITIPEYSSFRDDGPNSGYCPQVILRMQKPIGGNEFDYMDANSKE